MYVGVTPHQQKYLIMYVFPHRQPMKLLEQQSHMDLFPDAENAAGSTILHHLKFLTQVFWDASMYVAL